MKKLNPKIHGVIDYLTAGLFLAAPNIFKFADPRASALTRGTGAACAAMSLATDYPCGVLKKIPFRVHGTIELLTSVFLGLAPKLFGFGDDRAASRFFKASSAAMLAFWASSDYERPRRKQVRRTHRVGRVRRVARHVVKHRRTYARAAGAAHAVLSR